jgi:outer membrane cobalamin receptor
VDFTNNSAGNYSEWPAHFGATQTFNLSSGVQLKATGSADYLSGYGFHPGGRISSKILLNSEQNFFLETQAIPKLPSIQDRLYVLPSDGYTGNPGVKPEKVYAFIAGFEDRASDIETKSQIRAEVRNNAILLKNDFSTVENSGTAHFLSFSENAKVKINPSFQIQAQLLASYSRLSKTGSPYPRLPALSAGSSALFLPKDWLTLETQGKWMGRSTEANGSSLPAMLLLGEKVTISPNDEIQITLGLDNLLDSRIEMIRGFPLPGRMAYASFEMKF